MNDPQTSGTKENIEIAELRQDTTKKQTNALEARIRYFQDQQSNQLPGKILDLTSGIIVGAVAVGSALKKIIPENTQKKIIEIYQKILLAF